MPDTEFTVDRDTVIAFDRAYVASRDPQVAALWVGDLGSTNPDGSPQTNLQQPDRWNKAIELAKAGHIVDPGIDGIGGDPYFTMAQRAMLGVLSVQAAYTGVIIKTSLDLKDYPPFAPPAPPSQPSVDLVGPLLDASTGTYAASMLAQQLAKQGMLVNGTTTVHNGVTLSFKRIDGTMMGMGSTFLWVRA